MTRGRLAVVIAALDERRNVEALLPRLLEALASMPELESEVVFVLAGDDGTEQVVAGVPSVRGLRQVDRDGLAAAFRLGFAALDPATNLVATLDADLNHRPEELPRLVRALEARDADIVVGSRVVPGAAVLGGSLVKRAASRLGNFAIRLLFGSGIRDRTSGFRVYRRAALSELAIEGQGFSFLPAMLLAAERGGLRIVEEPISFDRRGWGRSKLPVVATALGYLKLALRARSHGRRRAR